MLGECLTVRDELKVDKQVGDVVAFNANTEYECLGLVVGKEQHHLCVVFLTHFAPNVFTAGGVVHPYNDDVTLYQRGSDLSKTG
jgi:hypothetical protein